MAEDHGPSVKNDKQYEGLRKKGMSKERAAKIANTEGDREVFAASLALRRRALSRRNLSRLLFTRPPWTRETAVEAA